MPELLSRFWRRGSVPLGDVAAMGRCRPARRRACDARRAPGLAEASQPAFRFGDYSARLLALARPGLLPVSVVVPNCNYGRYPGGAARLHLRPDLPGGGGDRLDDASTDDSVAVAQRTAAGMGAPHPAGTAGARGPARSSPNGAGRRRWRASEWLWIAEADDGAEPGLLGAFAAATRHGARPGLRLLRQPRDRPGRRHDSAGLQGYYGPAGPVRLTPCSTAPPSCAATWRSAT